VNGVGKISHVVGTAILSLATLFLPFCVWAQQAIVPLHLSFSDPGARSTGFGGAFVALADDATAAFANPAGLVQLLRPEVSVEARNWDYSMPYTQSGRLEGAPSGTGLDTTAGLIRGESRYEATGISYLSFVYPKGDWSFAAYRHQYADIEFYGETSGLFGGGTNCCQARWSDQQMSSRQNVVSYGLAGAYRLTDAVNIGLGLVYFDTMMSADTKEYAVDISSPEAFFGPIAFVPENLAIDEKIFISDNGWTFTAGILWNISERWHFGAVYRQGIEADLGNLVRAGAAYDPAVPAGTVLFENSGIPIEFPDVLGLGVAHQAMDGRLTLSFQWDRVNYSSIPESIGLDDQTIDDADELHFGAEYVFLDSTPIFAVRLGAWYEPDHQMYAIVDDLFTQAMLPRGADEWHYSAGIGIAMQRFQVDIAADFAHRVDTLSLSAIYNF